MSHKPRTGELSIMLVAGEPSGDQLGAKLVDSLRRAAGSRRIEFFGAAGVRMREAGVEPVVEADGLAIMGIAEIAGALPTFLRAFRRLRAEAEHRMPDVAVLIDFPDFNLRLAKALKNKGHTVVYFVSPQLWGWREYRYRTIRDHVDLLLAILPFEHEWYAARRVENVEYVGHPLAGNVRPSTSRNEFRSKFSLDPERPLVALLPGSRHKEISRILPPMIKAAAQLARDVEGVQFAIALAPTRTDEEVAAAIKEASRGSADRLPEFTVVKGATYDLLNASDAAAVASGTATLEAGLIGVPMAIVYKTSKLNYKLVRPLINVEHFGLINLIAGKRVVRELIQDDFTSEALAAELRSLLEPATNSAVRENLGKAAALLGEGGASDEAAKAILRIIDAKRRSSSVDPDPGHGPL
ncbi:MAG: lipid-A-disaccharide synthase [Chloracidobacterium sp.]|nr:lipid-A-disaccharide synthase [Chloracidobacterium sp.]